MIPLNKDNDDTCTICTCSTEETDDRERIDSYMATMKEIAQLAGVSRGTVDRVLNNRGGVNAQTEAKVREVIKAMDYKPNLAGITLAAQKKKLQLGVILFSGNPFFHKVLEGIQSKESELAGYGCSVTVMQITFSLEAQLSAIDQLVQDGVHGIALAPYNDNKVREKIDWLYEQGIPVVTFNTDIEHSKRIAYVGSNYYQAGQAAAGLMHLMSCHTDTQVGIILGDQNILCHAERVNGFRSRLEETYQDLHLVSLVENHDDEIESYEQTTLLLQTHPEINALYFAAAGVYGGCRAVHALGRKDMTIIAHDRVDATREQVLNGTIAATICQQPHMQGSRPLTILFNYLTAGELPEKELNHVAIDIRIRETI